MHMERCHKSKSSQVKCRAPRLGQPFWASLRNRNAHGHVRRAVFCKNAQVKCRRPRSRKTRAAEFVQACAIETHFTWTCHKNKFIRQFTGKKQNPGGAMEHPDQAPAWTPTVRAPQCGHTVWGTKCLQHPAASCSSSSVADCIVNVNKRSHSQDDLWAHAQFLCKGKPMKHEVI